VQKAPSWKEAVNSSGTANPALPALCSTHIDEQIIPSMLSKTRQNKEVKRYLAQQVQEGFEHQPVRRACGNEDA
jgi:hypothetical protein